MFSRFALIAATATMFCAASSSLAQAVAEPGQQAAPGGGEWRATPRPVEVENTMRCTSGLSHPDYFLGFNISDEASNFIMKSNYLVGVSGGVDSVIRFPAGLTTRVTLIKSAPDSDIAMIQVSSAADLNAMIDGFSAPGVFSVTVLGGRPTAFRLRELPGASDAITSLRGCMEELDLG